MTQTSHQSQDREIALGLVTALLSIALAACGSFLFQEGTPFTSLIDSFLSAKQA